MVAWKTGVSERWQRVRSQLGDALVAVMESADLGSGDDPATRRRFNDSWLGTVVFKRLVWPRGAVVGEIRAQDAAEMGPAQNDDVVQALPTDGADEPLDEGVLPGPLWGPWSPGDPQVVDALSEGLAVDRVSIPK
jgi:hypothetical protein